MEFCTNVKKHLQQSGAINRYLANIVFVGLPGSGKSTLIARLLKLKEVDEMLKASGSTGVMDGIIAVDIAEDISSMHAANVDDNCEWHKVKLGLSCLRQMGVGCFVLQQSHEDNTTSFQTSHTCSPEASEPKSTATNIGRPNSPSDEKSPESTTANSSPQNLMAAIQEVLGKEGFAAVRPFLVNKSSLYLSDTGECINLCIQFL